jgi:hypothetical protein
MRAPILLVSGLFLAFAPTCDKVGEWMVLSCIKYPEVHASVVLRNCIGESLIETGMIAALETPTYQVGALIFTNSLRNTSGIHGLRRSE